MDEGKDVNTSGCPTLSAVSPRKTSVYPSPAAGADGRLEVDDDVVAIVVVVSRIVFFCKGNKKKKMICDD